MSHIVESSAKLAKAGSRWKAVLITPGKGSSGIYSEEMLRSTGPSAFPAGTHSYIDHSEERSARDLFGVLAEDAEYEEGIGLVGVLEVMPHYAEFANAVAPHTGLSISAAAEKSKDANGEIIIESLIPNRMNSVDLVSYAGRGGAMAEKLLEAARSSFTTSSNVIEDSGTAPADDRNHNGKEKISKMEIEELATRVDTIAESLEKLAAVVTPLAESLAAEQEKAAKEAEEAKKAPELDFAAIAEAAIAADLPAAARKVVYEQVRLGGSDVKTAIEEQKKLVEDIKKSVEEHLNVRPVFVGTDDVNQDFTVSRWSN
jgi:hypothetical protein